tara:strand:+ start:325 stop:903 length:579 start_codon:yes stop_codon:yes gene_type:complete
MEILITSLLSYLAGSIPFGYIFTKIFLKKDIRNIGSGNIGATNALRTGNKLIGYTTLIFDILKAVLVVLLTSIYYSEYVYLASLSVFIGHIFPIWLKFRGGKGVATYLGILFCLDYNLGFVFIACWLIVIFIWKYSSLSSLISSLIIPLYIFIFNDQNNYYFYIIMFIMIFYTHRENIKRLVNNTESKTKIY